MLMLRPLYTNVGTRVRIPNRLKYTIPNRLKYTIPNRLRYTRQVPLRQAYRRAFQSSTVQTRSGGCRNRSIRLSRPIPPPRKWCATANVEGICDLEYIGHELHTSLERKIQIMIIDVNNELFIYGWNHVKDLYDFSSEISDFLFDVKRKLRIMPDKELIELLNFYYPKHMNADTFEHALNMKFNMASSDEWCTATIYNLGLQARFDFAYFGISLQEVIKSRHIGFSLKRN